MSVYDVYFSFTTVHSKSRFVGRDGMLNVETDIYEKDIIEVDWLDSRYNVKN